MKRITLQLPSRWTDEEVARYVLRKNICVHLKDNQEKVDFLIVCLRKLYYLANEQTISENSDAVNTQEVILPGHTYTSVFKESLQVLLMEDTRKFTNLGSHPFCGAPTEDFHVQTYEK